MQMQRVAEDATSPVHLAVGILVERTADNEGRVHALDEC